jgi:hypothetical protein
MELTVTATDQHSPLTVRYCLLTFENWKHGFESHSEYEYTSALFLCRQGRSEGLIPRPKSPI